jgi:hypothetical protein
MLRIAKIINRVFNYLFIGAILIGIAGILIFLIYKLITIWPFDSGITWYIIGCTALCGIYYWSDYIINKHK